jgi:hypothetical protein
MNKTESLYRQYSESAERVPADLGMIRMSLTGFCMVCSMISTRHKTPSEFAIRFDGRLKGLPGDALLYVGGAFAQMFLKLGSLRRASHWPGAVLDDEIIGILARNVAAILEENDGKGGACGEIRIGVEYRTGGEALVVLYRVESGDQMNPFDGRVAR